MCNYKFYKLLKSFLELTRGERKYPIQGRYPQSENLKFEMLQNLKLFEHLHSKQFQI